MTPEVALHRQIRGIGPALGMGACLVFFISTSWTETSRAFWNVGPAVVVPTGAATLIVTLLAMWVYRHFGQDSQKYHVVNALETTAFGITCTLVIAASGDPMNPMWIFHFGHLVHCGIAGFQRSYNRVLFLVLTVLMWLWFLYLGNLGATGLVFLLGLFSLYSYSMLSRTAELLRRTTQERDALSVQLTELRLEEERQRIARDLHDGFAGDLAALHWQIEGLRASLPKDETSERFFENLRQRLTQGADELRNIVWALRAGDLYWRELIAHLRTRCVELCASEMTCSFEAAGQAELTLSSEIHVQVARFVQEAVRNAVRHSRGSGVEVRLSLGAELLVTVTDNGVGISDESIAGSRGGLRNLERRIQSLGGRFEIKRLSPGTELRASIPVS